MKKIITLVSIFSFFVTKANDVIVENPFQQSFKKAYSIYPSVPKGVLEAVAFTQTRFHHLNADNEPSCIAYPRAYSVMGLTLDGKNYFRNNLNKVSQLSGFTTDAIIANAETSILAFAKAFNNALKRAVIHLTPFHPGTLYDIQAFCKMLERKTDAGTRAAFHLIAVFEFSF